MRHVTADQIAKAAIGLVAPQRLILLDGEMRRVNFGDAAAGAVGIDEPCLPRGSSTKYLSFSSAG